MTVRPASKHRRHWLTFRSHPCPLLDSSDIVSDLASGAGRRPVLSSNVERSSSGDGKSPYVEGRWDAPPTDDPETQRHRSRKAAGEGACRGHLDARGSALRHTSVPPGVETGRGIGRDARQVIPGASDAGVDLESRAFLGREGIGRTSPAPRSAQTHSGCPG
jgi:hypothetical protein